MTLSRRSLIGGIVASTSFPTLPALRVRAQEATPSPIDERPSDPGVAIARVRKLPTPELADAIFPDVMAHFLPGLEALPGYRGYVLAPDDQDPTAQITLTLVTDDAAAEEADEVAREYVSQLDPRFVVETPVALRGPVRIFAVTDRTKSVLPPFLYCTYLAMRQRQHAPDSDVEAVIETLRAELVPVLAAMPGFICYCWIELEGGGAAVNLWETLEQLEAGNEAAAAFVAESLPGATVGDPVIHQGMISYGELTALG